MSASSLVARWSAWAPELQSVLRIVAASIFVTAGTMKLFTFPAGMPPDGSTARVMSEIWIGGVLEAILYCFLWLYFSAAGAGPWRLDARIGRRVDGAAPRSS